MLYQAHLIMFFGMVFFHLFVMLPSMVYRVSDYYLSLGQLYMAMMMGFGMVLLEAVMHPLPPSLLLLAGAGMVGMVVLYRWQVGVSGEQYVREMIPHHSMAILTSTKQETSRNPKIAQLAHLIRQAQELEIQEMKDVLL